MRGLSTTLVLLALLGGRSEVDGVSAATTSTGAPDLAACPASELVDEGYREREGPIPVPPEFGGLVAADMDHFAVSTFSGSTICVDTAWMETIDGANVSPDERFLAFEWAGYEAFGNILVDRSGAGQVIETGNAALPSPTGKRFASVDLSESGFGGFNAFGVWQIEAVGLRELAKVQDGLPAGDWRMAGWSGDHCINLSLLPIERQPSEAGDLDTAARDPWSAAESNGWTPAPGPCPKA